MRKGILLLITLIVLSITTSLRAQEAETITLQEAIDLALENNFQLKQAKNNLDLAELQVLNAKGDFLPSLSGSFGGSRNQGVQFVPGSDEFVNRVVKSVRGSISSSVPIFQGFQNINNLRSSRLDTESEEENVQRIREQVIFNAVSNYLQVLLDKELLEIDRQNLASSRQTLEQVKAQVEVGSRPTVDLFNQESTVAQNELQVVNSENALQNSRILLIRTLQIEPLGVYEFVTPEINADDVSEPQYTLDQMVRLAMENRSDLESQELVIESTRHQLKAARGTLFPSLSFSGSISTNASDQSNTTFGNQFTSRNVNKNVGFTLSIPFFSNFNRRTNIQSQEIQLRNARLNLQDLELQVVQDVNQALTDYKSFIKQLEASQKSLTAAERSYQTEQERYDVGAGTLIELSDARAAFVEAQANRAQALYRVVFQEKLLDFYLGRLNSEVSLQ